MLIFFAFLALIAGALVITAIALQTAAASALERDQNLISAWTEEKRNFDELTKNANSESVGSLKSISASLKALSERLADPKAATIAYVEKAEEIKAGIDSNRTGLPPDQVKAARDAIDRGIPSLAKAILKVAAAQAAVSKNISQQAASLFQVGQLSVQEGNYLEADDYFRRALELAPSDTEYLRGYQSSSFVLARYGQSADLINRLREALRGLGGLTPDVSRRLDMDLADIYLAQSRFSDGEAIYKRLKAAMEGSGDIRSENYGVLLNNFGSLYHNWGRYADAEPLLRSALDVLVAVKGPDDSEVAYVINNVAYLEVLKAEYGEVDSLLKEAVRILVKAHGPNHWSLIVPFNNFGRFYTKEGKYDDANERLQDAMKLCSDKLMSEHPTCARTWDLVADLNIVQKKFGLACDAVDNALKIKRKYFDEMSLDVAHTLNIEGTCLLGLDQPQKAFPIDSQAMDIVTSLIGTDNLSAAAIQVNLGDYFLRQGFASKARDYYGQAFKTREQFLGHEHPDTLAVEQVLRSMDSQTQGKD